MTTYYVDYEGGAGSADGSSFDNRVSSVSGLELAQTVVSGDVIRVKASPAATSLGQTATWTTSTRTTQNRSIALTTAVTTNITTCDSGWVNSANVTGSTTGTRKEGTAATNHIIASGFTTGKVAYFATGALDLSGYQQISFWAKSSIDTGFTPFRIKLCSDTTGDTPVNSTPAGTLLTSLKTGQWSQITYDFGTALGSNINSVALYLDSDIGALTLNLDNIIACKASSSADSLTLRSLIGKNTAAEPWWYTIKSINGTTITLDGQVNDGVTASRGYVGVSGSFTTWKRTPINVQESFYTLAADFESPVFGTNNSPEVVISGGWDRTNMSTQTDTTFLDMKDGFTTGFNLTGARNTSIDHFGFSRFNIGVKVNGQGNSINNCQAISCTDSGFIVDGPSTGDDLGVAYTVTNTASTVVSSVFNGQHGIAMTTSNASTLDATVFSNAVDGINMTGTNNNRFILGTVLANNNGSAGINANSAWCLSASSDCNINGTYGVKINSQRPCIFNQINATSNVSGGVDCSANTFIGYHKIYGLTTSSNASTGPAIVLNSTNIGELFLKNASISETTKFTTLSNGRSVKIHSQREGGDVNVNKIYQDNGTITSTTSNRHTASGLAWQLDLTGNAGGASGLSTFLYPLSVPVARFLANANNLVTVKAWIMRTDTDVLNIVRIPGGRLAGIASDVTATGTAGANTYEEVTLTCTPTEAGVIEVFYEASDPTGSPGTAYIDDLTITQA